MKRQGFRSDILSQLDRRSRRGVACVLLVLVASVNILLAGIDDYKVLVFSKTTGFRHDSIPNGIAMIRELGGRNHFSIDATEDATVFNDENLVQYQAVVFLNTTGTVLDDDQKAAFERYIESGGGYVGIHSASDTEYDWTWYGGLVGAYFASHPAIQPATLKVADRVHPSSARLPLRWGRRDEWYNFRLNPRGRVHVLATLDESTYEGGAMGFDHPIAWCQRYDGGRAWYTAGGHTRESYAEPLFQAHVLGGIEFAAGVQDGDCGATIDSNFRKVVLDDKSKDPISLAVANDGRVFYIERDGTVKIFRPETSDVIIAGEVQVFTGRPREDGLLGITLDPDFDTNHWLYLFYSPAGSVAKQHISRFTMVGDRMDVASEKILLEIPTQRQECCHSGGCLRFGPDRNLYISTGDNTNPFASDAYTPIDERPGRSPWDAQKSASNTNDLRGKILRVHPEPDGTYTIPKGNLFPEGDRLRRPEIYIMGCRNPFRMTLDSETGWLYWGDVGPDAFSDNPRRGPRGYDEFNRARGPGNYGWPYIIADNQPYVRYDFATGQSGDPFDPDALVNESPNNTGARELPPAQPAFIWYPYAPSTEFPELNGGGTARTGMAGPVYHYDADLASDRKLPAYYDKTFFIYEWSRRWIKEIKLDEDGNILKINPFLPGFTFLRPIEMQIGPDGAIYMIEWGSNFGGGNRDAKLVRIDYIRSKK